MSELKPRHMPGWPTNSLKMLERVEQRWSELQEREVSNSDFSCLMSDVSDFIHEQRRTQQSKTSHEGLVEALEAANAHFKKHHWNETFQEYDNRIVERVVQKIQAALEQAKGGE